jgi:hypothetical protein
MAHRDSQDGLLSGSATTGAHATPSAEASSLRDAEASPHDRAFADDLLRGADEIAEFLFGDRMQRRKVYHLATSRLPVFRLGGSMLCARKSALLKFVEDQERRGRKDEDPTSRKS